jgi:beta-phosphoglucomutase-like phosphatase (HAD superfamily)
MKITVKVNPRGRKAPASVVRNRLKNMRSTPKVEEVFPGLRSGRRAGMVTVDVSDEDSEHVLQELRADDAIEYAESTTQRKPKKKHARRRA